MTLMVQILKIISKDMSHRIGEETLGRDIAGVRNSMVVACGRQRKTSNMLPTKKQMHLGLRVS